MVLINEWLPNPKGSDTSGEWIELANTGMSSVNLKGWELRVSSGHKFTFGDVSIGSGEHLVLPRTFTKLTLRNTAEVVMLYDASGKKVDESALRGVAQEGKSVSRMGDHFVVGDPTPGGVNRGVSEEQMIQGAQTPGIISDNRISGFSVLILAITVGVVLAALALFVFKKNNDLSELFFGKY